jgi:hypothetical protein
MPRRNHTQKVTRKIPQLRPEAQKTRYASRQSAQKAAEQQMLYYPELQLSIYQSPYDGGWYLTSKPTPSTE